MAQFGGMTVSLEAKLMTEYKRMIDRWESGSLYYQTKEYIKTYTIYSIRPALKEYICAVLACARVGLPITSSLVAWLTGKKTETVYIVLEHLTSLKVLESIPTESKLRKYKLTSEFIKTVYSRLAKEG